MAVPHDVEEEVHVRPVQAGEPVQHDDVGVGLVGLLEEVLLEGALLLDGGEEGAVVVVGQDPAAVVVQDGDRLHGVQRRGLKRTRHLS